MSDPSKINEPIRELMEFLKKLPGDKKKCPEKFTPCDIQGFEQVMNVGTQFLYVSDLLREEIVYVSPTIRHITGYDANEVSLEMIYETIHPADRREAVEATIDALNAVLDMETIEPGKITSHVNFRFRKKDGSYIMVLRQTSVLKVDEEGHMVQSLAIITDIDHLSKGLGVEGRMVENETGRVMYHKKYYEEDCPFSSREREVVEMIARGNNSKEIASQLHISHNTVLTHRRNILSKAELRNTAELLIYSKEHGII